MEIEELKKQLDKNTERIIENLNKIEHNSNKIDENSKRIQQNSYAFEILKDYKSSSKRLFIILVIVLFMWFLTIGYLVYVLNDIDYVDEYEITQDNDNGDNNYIGNDGDIVYGETNN